MKLDTEFIRLPLRFDVERMREEVAAIPETDWRPHPQGHPGNSALPLIAHRGDPRDDGTAGEMRPTPSLAQCPYLQQVLESFETVIGRSRLMRLEGRSEATLHVDTNYYWADRVRIHVPIVTSPVIEFICGERSLHMAAGEAWIFDAWRPHNVINPTGDQRIHLVADTTGSARFWGLVARGERPFAEGATEPQADRTIAPEADRRAALETERTNYPVVMSPWEQQTLAAELRNDLRPDASPPSIERLDDAVGSLLKNWRMLWSRHGEAAEGWPEYRRLLERFGEQLAPLEGRLTLANGTDAVEIARQMLIRPALNPQLAPSGSNGAGGTRSRSAPGKPGAGALAEPARVAAERVAPRSKTLHRFERPIFIVAPPRSGTSLLFETLARSPSLFTVGGESHRVIEQLPELTPENRGWDSNRLTRSDAVPHLTERLRAGFLAELRDRDGKPPPQDESPFRMLEKTPKNSLRIPFLDAVFPGALFIYLHRDPREALSSMIAAWESGRFVTYPDLPGWDGPPWSLVLTPEWRKLRGRPLAEIVASQWAMTTQAILADLDRVAAERVHMLDFERFLDDPTGEIQRICEFADLEFDRPLPHPLPPSMHTLTPPEASKWRQHEAVLEPVIAQLAPVDERARALLASPPRERAPEQRPPPGSPLRSVSAGNFSELLDELGSSLLISTYQTGKLICARRAQGGLNTHFRDFDLPMGLAWNGETLAVGARSQVWEYRNLPAVAEKLEPAPERHDACLMPRRVRYTGDVRIHDVAYAGDELWIVATRFSCLATLDDAHSFVPRWRPKFVTSLAADDRCHLNGMAVVGDRVAYVTALGASDEPGGWRPRKADGGVLVDVESSETIAAGLSMPHSPRWYRDRLWMLESGQGALATVDLDSGAVETVAELPGFTRGLAFAGPLAFVGLSEVREATTFGGLPLTGRLEERQCGVWVVNIETGKTVALLRFEDRVQEIFDVAALPGIRFPEIAEHGSDAVNLSYVLPDAPTATAARAS